MRLCTCVGVLARATVDLDQHRVVVDRVDDTHVVDYLIHRPLFHRSEFAAQVVLHDRSKHGTVWRRVDPWLAGINCNDRADHRLTQHGCVLTSLKAISFGLNFVGDLDICCLLSSFASPLVFLNLPLLVRVLIVKQGLLVAEFTGRSVDLELCWRTRPVVRKPNFAFFVGFSRLCDSLPLAAFWLFWHQQAFLFASARRPTSLDWRTSLLVGLVSDCCRLNRRLGLGLQDLL